MNRLRNNPASRRSARGKSALYPLAAGLALALIALLSGGDPAEAAPLLTCGHFTREVPAAPAPREAAWAKHRFEEINAAVKGEPHRVLFLGDSITQRFDKQVWQERMVPRGVLNAGVSGDRTEHLLWRLQHGNLAGPPPAVAVLLIGTNDLGHGRKPQDAAEGIRADLSYLRRHLPDTRILLLGLWPRGATREDRLRRGTVAVNRLIQSCGNDRAVIYADIGGVLLDPVGRLTRAISPDLLHFSHKGYGRLATPLDALIDQAVAGR